MLSGIRSRLPFGIGTVVMLAIVAMIASVGAVLAIKSDAPHGGRYTAGQLRAYPGKPEAAWTRDLNNLPEFGPGSGPVDVADTHGETWLLSYPSGIGKAFLAVNRYDGKSRWEKPVKAGLGDCAFNAHGEVACATKLGDGIPDGFYKVDAAGKLGPARPLDDTVRLVGVGQNFVRVNQVGYQLTASTPEGVERWHASFASAATPLYLPEIDTLDVKLADGSHALVDPATGKTKLSCGPCTLHVYPTGLAVEHGGSGGVIDFHAFHHGKLVAKPTHIARSMQVATGPAALPVIWGLGSATLTQAEGHYEVRDPAEAKALWAVSDKELSKAKPFACGRLVAFTRKDATRDVMRLDERGTRVGVLPAPDRQRPDTNPAELRCVGSFGNVIVAWNENQVTAFNGSTGKIDWELPINGNATSVEGQIVLRQGATLSVLRAS
ncbi:MAG: hypothetical protein QM728_02165 [Gordonia sp. (in: high G+C Gram-positive bacteria)]|uniref:hypothetical protein n=1 Tax=Gordonia sp. (in: high G+C Gram-positive bacteria) TaxID=84139 RepID=UPI0039E28AEB